VPILKQYSTAEQKEKYLPGIAAGSTSLSLAWLEPGKDYSMGEVACEVLDNGDTLILDGVKELVPDGDMADAFVVIARNSQGEISLILVDQDDKLPVRRQNCVDASKHVTEITFDQWSVPKSQLLGTWEQGKDILEEGVLHLNAGLSSLQVGGMASVV